jgi:hypothetical protein
VRPVVHVQARVVLCTPLALACPLTAGLLPALPPSLSCLADVVEAARREGIWRLAAVMFQQKTCDLILSDVVSQVRGLHLLLACSLALRCRVPDSGRSTSHVKA